MDTIITDFANAWKTFNPELIIKHLSPDFQYNSQWVFESLDYNGYIEYIRNKFETLKQRNIILDVEIVDDSIYGGKMLRIIQAGESIVYRIKTKNAHVIKGDMCMFWIIETKNQIAIYKLSRDNSSLTIISIRIRFIL